mmetsp:Transcript_6863/g.17754  ORF Transcript_6863/g.17754 Transcript_6863/m.17754 type:complete len:205 (+) Transcript_6863:624-1238(+)
MPSSLMLAMETAAKASLISNASMSSTLWPVCRRSFSTASAGVVGNFTGSCSASANPTTRASGLRPSAWHLVALISTTAAAPSLIELAFAAVIVPLPERSKAGLRALSLSMLKLPPFLSGSSSETVTTSRLTLTLTGTISSLKWPPWCALSARSIDAIAKASCSSREICISLAHFSPQLPMCTLSYGSQRPSLIMPSCTVLSPMR